MENVLSVAQIESQYPDEWILIENPLTNAARQVQSGQVRFHGKDRDEVYRKAIELRLKRFALLYTGGIPEDTAVVRSAAELASLRLCASA